jgi:hypothetical protein
MGLAITTIDKQINNYLSILNIRQKKALLNVAKTLAQEQVNDYSDEFKAELHSRYEEYKNGGTLVSEADANERINSIIKGKPKEYSASCLHKRNGYLNSCF